MFSAAPGTAAYFPSILARIREVHPDLPLDPIILQSLLLCIIAGDSTGGCADRHGTQQGCKHLLLRTKEEDVGMVLNLTVSILTVILGFPTHKCRIKPQSGSQSRPKRVHVNITRHPDEFLRALFFRGHIAAHPDAEPIGETRKSDTLSGTSGPGRYPPRHSSTSPLSSDGRASTETHFSTAAPQIPADHRTRESTEDSAFDVTSLASSRRSGPSPSSTMHTRPQPHRTQTAIPLISAFTPPNASAPSSQPLDSGPGTRASIAKALVVSGLEYAELPAQRALLQVLSERKLALAETTVPHVHAHSHDQEGTWNLPDDFLLVYVCPLEASERPPILRALVDRFAMSADINVSQDTRRAYVACRTSICSTPLSSSMQSPSPRSPHSPSQPLPPLAEGIAPLRASLPRNASFTPSFRVPSNSGPPIFTSDNFANLRALTRPPSAESHQLSHHEENHGGSHSYTAIHPTLDVYLLDLFSATRHHPELDGTLLTLRAHRDAEDLARAYRVIGGDTLGTELLTSMAELPTSSNASASYMGSRANLSTEEGSLGWGKDGPEVRIQAPDTPLGDSPYELRDDDDANRPVGIRLPSPLPPPPEIWDVSEVDIARIFPRVVTHRLRVRDGPHDEILGSVMFPAAGWTCPEGAEERASVSDEPEGTPGRRSVKEILVEILADV